MIFKSLLKNKTLLTFANEIMPMQYNILVSGGNIFDWMGDKNFITGFIK